MRKSIGTGAEAVVEKMGNSKDWMVQVEIDVACITS